MLGGDKGGGHGAGAEAEGDGGDVPAGSDPFAGDVGGDLEDDVGDVENGQESVVVIALEVEVRL